MEKVEKILNLNCDSLRIGRRRTPSMSDLSCPFPFTFDGPDQPKESCSDNQTHDHGLTSLETIADSNYDEIIEQANQFIQNLASDEDKSLKSPDIPDCVEALLKMIESQIAMYEQREANARLLEDTKFVEAVSLVSKLVKILDSKAGTDSWFNQVGSCQHRAMSLLDYELRSLLDNARRRGNDQKTPKTPKQSSFNSNQDVFGQVESSDQSKTEEEFPGFSPETISKMNQITSAMIYAGYEEEPRMSYIALRLKALDAELNKQGFENINVDDVQRMNWESLEGEIGNWIGIVKHCTTNLFPAERKLSKSVFSEYPLIAKRLFINLATSVTVRLLTFANAVVLIRPYSIEKLFKFLDIYEALRDLIRDVDDDSSSLAQDLIFETSMAQSRVGEAAVSIFCQLENSIKSDNGRIPVASGAVHPLTRYTMNYLKYACEYKDTLEHVFQQHYVMEAAMKQRVEEQECKNMIENDNEMSPKTSPFAVKVMMVMELLDANIEMKSKLYRDPALCYIFLMNNGRYILQKIKGSAEINEMMGQSWSRKRTSDLRQYHKNYQRETWSKVLQCINPEGLLVNGKVSKPLLKERFKNFNALFDEITKTQSTWVVSDEQLQSELRISISAVVIPAYRSFLGRFNSCLDHGRQAEKYIKYQPEDIEGLIEQLFDGNATSMGRRRT